MKNKIVSSLIGLSLVMPLYAAENINLEEVTVKANRFENKDTETSYASEIHTSRQIEVSGATTLVEYLTQQTSLNILSNFGSKATPSINLRGYGNENGSQNVVITLDGQRLNNIDGPSQLLSAIPLGNIERIEISKGSGSVIYGDGATAGAIQIYTKHKSGITVSDSIGNYGQQNHYLNAGINNQYIDISANVARDTFEGFSDKDSSGHRDEFTSNTQNVKLNIKPVENIHLFAEVTNSRNDLRYASPLSLAQFNSNPRSVGLDFLGNPINFTHQGLSSEQWKVGAEYKFTNALTFSYAHFQEDKISNFVDFNSIFNYDYSANDFSLKIQEDRFNAIIGYQTFNGDRKAISNVTSKNNKAIFISGDYRPEFISDAIMFSAGARREKVEYRFSPISGLALVDHNILSAWDIGLNYRINDETTFFANYNQAFQTPDIDRFFTQDYSLFPIITTTFNGFIKPENVKTLNIGLNLNTKKNRLNVTSFYASLDDEMYLLKPFFLNINLDRSHKYGLEVQDTFKFNEDLSASLIYNYTRAIIDREDDNGYIIQNKDLPGAPKHTLIANLNYRFLQHANLNINNTWRSCAYAYDDFQNNFVQKQYNSTNVALNYQFKNFNIFTSVTNLFEHANSIQVADDAIYPVDYLRTWRVGIKANF